MDMQRIQSLMTNLRLANECEAAAEMDVADVKGCIAIYEQKLKAAQDRLAECEIAAEEAGETLAHAIAEMTYAPILLIEVSND